jgi:hypothetical protein
VRQVVRLFIADERQRVLFPLIAALQKRPYSPDR